MTAAVRIHLDQRTLKQHLHYDPETGVFTRLRADTNTVTIGEVAGGPWYRKAKPDDKYWVISIENIRYQAHRLAWLYMTGEWPEDKVDHWDHDGLNNRWKNLRAATHVENIRNSRIRSNNTSGYKGVSWDVNRGKWQVGIRYDGKRHALGRFDDKEEAIAAYAAAAKRIFGEFAYLGDEKA